MTADRLAQALECAEDALTVTLAPAGEWPAAIKSKQRDALKQIKQALDAHRNQSPAEAHELAPCPFCGEPPTTVERPDNIDGTGFFFAAACYCGGYSACAHKMAVRKTPEEAKAVVVAAWNARAAKPQPKHTALTDDQINAAAEEIDTEPAFVAGYWHGYKAGIQSHAPGAEEEEHANAKAWHTLREAWNTLHQLGFPYANGQTLADAIRAAVQAPAVTHAAPEPIRCPERVKNGGTCPHHNLHCGWPDCNKEKA